MRQRVHRGVDRLAARAAALPWFKRPRAHKLFHAGLVVLADLGIVFILLNLGLFVLMQDRLPPFTRVNSVSVGLLGRDEAARQLEARFGDPEVQLLGQAATETARLSELGLKLDGPRSLAVVESGFWRSWPLVRTVRAAFAPAPPAYHVDDAKLDAYLRSKIKDSYQAPKEPTVKLDVQAGTAAIVPGEPGERLDAPVARRLLLEALATGNLRVELTPIEVPPSRTEVEVASVRDTAQALLARELTLEAAGESLMVPADELRSLVVVKELKSGGLKADISASRLKSYLKEAFAPLVAKPAEAQHQYFRDGKLVERVGGKTGQALDLTRSTEAALAALRENKPTAALTASPVTLAAIKHSSYSPTSNGLSWVIKDFAAAYPGDYQVVVRELTGSGRNASYQASTATVPASTYKVFVAYAALKQIENGKLSLSSKTSYGTVKQAMEDMILNSGNVSAEALLDKLTYAKVDQLIQAAGFTSTRVSRGVNGYMTTIASDQAAILRGLHNGSLLDDDHTDYLLGLMKRQRYRAGIPAGSHGATVADKVGFLQGWNHDMGIVYTPKATYILVVMTTNSSFSNISVLADRVYNFFN